MYVNEAPKPIGKVRGVREDMKMITAIYDSNIKWKPVFEEFRDDSSCHNYK